MGAMGAMGVTGPSDVAATGVDGLGNPSYIQRFAFGCFPI